MSFQLSLLYSSMLLQGVYPRRFLQLYAPQTNFKGCEVSEVVGACPPAYLLKLPFAVVPIVLWAMCTQSFSLV